MRVPYVREAGILLAALLLVAWSVFCWVQGGKSARLDCVKADKARAVAHAKALEAEAAKRAKIAARLAEVLARPKVGPQVRTVIRENPSLCRVPPAVHGSVQRAIREANASR